MGQISVNNALVLGFTFVIAGLTFLYLINPLCAMLGAISIFIYACVYTPLKLITPLSVFVGAIPGAIPFMLGWVAATNELGVEALALFLMQFFWQFPHFWAIAWVAHEDYSKAGFKLLPADKGPTKFTAIQGIMYSVLMIPVGILPYYFGYTGMTSAVIVIMCNVFMVVQSIRLYQQMDVKSARRVMFSSYIYLPIVLLALLADKIK